MNCRRCSGLMAVDHFIDMEDDGGHLWLRGWRCINCGAIVSPETDHPRPAGSLRDRLANAFTKRRAGKPREVVCLGA